MRVTSWINIVNIKVDRYSISKQTFDLAQKIESGKINVNDLPPIKVFLNKQGTFILKDGRHRITAYKLLGLTKIKAKYYRHEKTN